MGIGELHARVLEVELAIAKGPNELLVDEEDGRRVERRRAIPVRTEEPRERVGVLPSPWPTSGRRFLPVIIDVTEYEVCGVGQ